LGEVLGPETKGRDVADVVIENPILNSPFEEPGKHWRFSDEGITNDIVESWRMSAYFVRIGQRRMARQE